MVNFIIIIKKLIIIFIFAYSGRFMIAHCSEDWWMDVKGRFCKNRDLLHQRFIFASWHYHCCGHHHDYNQFICNISNTVFGAQNMMLCDSYGDDVEVVNHHWWWMKSWKWTRWWVYWWRWSWDVDCCVDDCWSGLGWDDGWEDIGPEEGIECETALKRCLRSLREAYISK